MSCSTSPILLAKRTLSKLKGRTHNYLQGLNSISPISITQSIDDKRKNSLTRKSPTASPVEIKPVMEVSPKKPPPTTSADHHTVRKIDFNENKNENKTIPEPQQSGKIEENSNVNIVPEKGAQDAKPKETTPKVKKTEQPPKSEPPRKASSPSIKTTKRRRETKRTRRIHFITVRISIFDSLGPSIQKFR